MRLVSKLFGVAALCAVMSLGRAAVPSQACSQPLYLTFDTGHMGVAPLIAEVLQVIFEH